MCMALVQWLICLGRGGFIHIYWGSHVPGVVVVGGVIGVERQQDVTLRIRAGRPGVQRPRAGKPRSFAGRHGGSETP